MHVPSITKNQILKVSFDDFKPLQHDNLKSKSSFCNRKKLHLAIVIEYDKPHEMVHVKILYDQDIIRDFEDLTALHMSYNICLYFLTAQIFLSVRLRVCIIQGVQNIRGYLLSLVASVALHAKVLSVMIWMAF